MGSFDGDTWKIYLSQEARERRDEIIDHLRDNYEGPSHYLREKLVEENALDVEQQIERTESEMRELEEKLKRLRQIKEERDQQQTLRDKKELLQQKQDKLRDLRENAELSEEQVEQEIIENLKGRSALPDSEEEIRETRAFSKLKEKRFGGENLDKLLSDVQRLQEEVRELNGGEELDCFLELGQEPAEVSS